jgi:high-affinity iron transporter
MKFIFKFAGLAIARAAIVGGGTVLLGACHPRASPSEPRDGGDAQRLVAILDYVAGDYGLSVRHGRVTSPAEYEEQLRFLADAQAMAHDLVGSGAHDPLLLSIAAVDRRVRARDDPAAVGQDCRRIKDDVVVRFGLRTMPDDRPSLPRAEALYQESCASCHGSRGDAQTERARQLDPHPASFRDPKRLIELSPYRVYNALTFGVPGTAMAAFDTLSRADRWDLAFYVFRLGHEGQPAAGPAAMTLADMAVRSDREVLAALVAENHPSPLSGLGYLRREAAFQEAPAGVGIETTRRQVRAALEASVAGRMREADRLVLDAYLEGFEPLEPRLRPRLPAQTAAVEASFRDLRAALSRGDSSQAREAGRRLQALLGQLEGPHQGLPAVGAFLIYLREGLEAALLIGALLAGLRRLGRPDAVRYVHLGWVLALPAGVLTWWLLERILSASAASRELMEAALALVAAVVLFSVSFWMISRAESHHWMAYLRGGLETSLSRRNLVLVAGLAFLAAYREAAETVLFTQALMLESGGSAAGQVWAGAAAGLTAVAGAAFLMSRTVVRLPLRPFFAVSGVLLCGLAISFAGSGIYELVAGGYLPPRPVAFPEVAWMGIHPDLTALLVQLAIVCVIAAAGVSTLRSRIPAPEVRPKR